MSSNPNETIDDVFSAVSSVGASVEVGGDFDTVKVVKFPINTLILFGIGIIVFSILIGLGFKLLSLIIGGVT